MKHAISRSVAMLFLLVGVAEAQRNCVKGKPCGGTCIAMNRTCRVGQLPPEPKATQDTVRPTAIAPAANPIAPVPEIQTPLPLRSPSIFGEFATALREWRGQTVIVRNSADAIAFRPPLLLADVFSDYLVVLAGGTRAMLPFTSIEMVYSDRPVTSAGAVLTIVVRR
jgi:hypothetical protein